VGALFVDIRFKPFPVSWQDTGTGIATLALALAAFLTDIYCY
jgi:hypothetical protein